MDKSLIFFENMCFTSRRSHVLFCSYIYMYAFLFLVH